MGADPVSLGLMAASTVMQVVGSVKQGNAQAKSYQYEASIDDTNAQLAYQDGAAQEAAIRKQGRAASGEMIAAQGASGVQVGTGSALEALRENAINSAYDALSARYQAATKAYGYKLDANRQRAAASDARTAGFVRAGSAILQGASNINSTVRLARAQNPNASGMSMPTPNYYGFSPSAVY